MCSLEDEDDVMTSVADDVIVVGGLPVPSVAGTRRVFARSRLGMLSTSACLGVFLCACMSSIYCSLHFCVSVDVNIYSAEL